MMISWIQAFQAIFRANSCLIASQRERKAASEALQPDYYEYYTLLGESRKMLLDDRMDVD
jgi:hypothetical protein